MPQELRIAFGATWSYPQPRCLRIDIKSSDKMIINKSKIENAWIFRHRLSSASVALTRCACAISIPFISQITSMHMERVFCSFTCGTYVCCAACAISERRGLCCHVEWKWTVIGDENDMDTIWSCQVLNANTTSQQNRRNADSAGPENINESLSASPWFIYKYIVYCDWISDKPVVCFKLWN